MGILCSWDHTHRHKQHATDKQLETGYIPDTVCVAMCPIVMSPYLHDFSCDIHSNNSRLTYVMPAFK